MGNGHAEADPGAEDRLPFEHRAEHLLERSAGVGDHAMGQLRDDPALVGGHQGEYDLVRRQQLGQQHGSTRGSMGQT